MTFCRRINKYKKVVTNKDKAVTIRHVTENYKVKMSADSRKKTNEIYRFGL